VGCNCGRGRAKRETYKVKLPGGLEVTKSSEAAAVAFAAKHPGATVRKVA
jgi:hypothetical protein